MVEEMMELDLHYFVVNLEDSATPGKVEKVIEVRDDKSLDITNSLPGTPVVITADTTRGIKFKGALVYTCLLYTSDAADEE